jgi:hypothetical protein
MHLDRIFPLLALASLAAAPLAAQTPVRPGETVRGVLEASDPRLQGGQHYDAYVVQGRPGERVMVTLRSDEIDTVLYWGRDAGGTWTEVDSNDDYAGDTNSSLVITLGAAGEHQLRASSYGEDETGAYELRLLDPSVPTAGEMYLDHIIHGELGEDTDFRGEAGPEDHYVFEGTSGPFVAILQSDEFDPVLVLGAWENGALRVVATDDDGGPGNGSVVGGRFSAEVRENRLVVRSANGQGTGSYVLRLVSRGSPADYAGQ